MSVPASLREFGASRWSERALRIAGGTLVPLLLLLLWDLIARAGVFRPDQLPPPAQVWEAGVDLARDGVLWSHTTTSTRRVLVGFAIGGTLGVGVGALVGLSRFAGSLLSPTIGGLRAVPSLAWVPLLVLWLRIGEGSKITLIAIGAFFPAYTTVASALRHVDRHLVEAGRAYGLRGPRLLTGVLLPAATPSVIAGLRLALAQSFLFLVAAELIASSQGLGFLLIDSQNNGRTDRLVLAIVLLAILGKTTDALLGIAERWALRRWT
ncbi:MAG: ABC transporter permease [Sporichthyaceae bacterium]